MTHRKKEKVIINPLPEGTLLTGGKQQYRIKKALGQGSFGITYRATTLMQGPLGAIEIDVAVKEFFMLSYNSRQGSSVTYGGSDDLFMHYKQMFAREARNLSSLNHRNIVKVLEYFEANNTYYYVMEYCRGGSLNEKIAEKDHLSEEESLHYFAQLTSAVSHMHDHKMLHLDIKPDNIVLRENGELVLIDFGLSKQYTADGCPETSTSIGLGTPGYAPIEQAKHRRDSKDFAATLDVYAVGATLFKMLTGQRPPEAADVMEGFPAYMLLEKGVNTHLIQCISKAMSLRTKRYPTIRHFVQDIAHEIDLEDDTDIEDEGKTDVNDENKTPYDRRHPAPEPIIIDIEPEIVEPREEQEMEKPQKPRRNTSWLWVALVGISVGVSAILGLRGCHHQAVIEAEQHRLDSIAQVVADSLERVRFVQDSIEAAERAEAKRIAEAAEQQVAEQERWRNLIPMVYVQGGTFTMGATSEQGSDAYSDEKPAHGVTVGSFYMGKYEVTQAQYEAVMGSNPSHFKGSNLPVECVSYDEAKAFCRKLSELTGRTYRLPTEAEWEYAARGGNRSQGYKYSGSNNIDEVAWYDGNSGSTTHAVGSKRANELGLYDMSGNVWEWCSDWYDSSYYSTSPQNNPKCASSGSSRVLRGGSWIYYAQNCRVSNRNNNTPSNRNNNNGFRVVCVP